jgi:hypothetical protein
VGDLERVAYLPEQIGLKVLEGDISTAPFYLQTKATADLANSNTSMQDSISCKNPRTPTLTCTSVPPFTHLRDPSDHLITVIPD